jgi:hypothetical protein
MLMMGFQVAYGPNAEIEIKKKEAANWGGLLQEGTWSLQFFWPQRVVAAYDY